MTCQHRSEFCEVCSCVVERNILTGEVHSCGLELGDMADLDQGYVDDCPFDVESTPDLEDDYEE